MFRLYIFILAFVIFSPLLSKPAFAIRLGSFELNPFLSIKEEYTDNVFNTNSDEKSDLSTTISPGIKVLFPRQKKNYKLELLYQADLERYHRYSSENADNHKATVDFEIRFPAGIEIGLSDKFIRTHDPRGVNLYDELDFYRDNKFIASIGYSFAERFKIRFDYTNYLLNYEAERNNFRDRTDNTFAFYLYYKFLPKTSAFIEYDHVIVDFDESNDFDSVEEHFFGGITWEVTGKTKGTIKAGYGTKDFKGNIEGFKGYIAEANIDHNFTPRHSIKITAIRRTNETNVFGSDFFVTTGLAVDYFQRLTGKITARASASYGRDSFRGELSRKDDTLTGGLGIFYQIRKWLITEAEYLYTKRDSTFDDFDYKNNRFLIRITATL